MKALVTSLAAILFRFENLQEEMKLVSRHQHPGVRGHRRTPSNVSNVSIESEMSVSTNLSDETSRTAATVSSGLGPGDDASEDQGYGSGRRQNQRLQRSASDRQKPPPTSQQQQQVSPTSKLGDDKVAVKDTDLGVMTRLQHRVKDLERDKQRLRRELDRYSGADSDVIEGDAARAIHDSIKVCLLVVVGLQISSSFCGVFCH